MATHALGEAGAPYIIGTMSDVSILIHLMATHALGEAGAPYIIGTMSDVSILIRLMATHALGEAGAPYIIGTMSDVSTVVENIISAPKIQHFLVSFKNGNFSNIAIANFAIAKVVALNLLS